MPAFQKQKGRPCIFLPWAQRKGKHSRLLHLFPRQTGAFRNAVQTTLVLWTCFVTAKVIISSLPCITQWILKCASHQMASRIHFTTYSHLFKLCASPGPLQHPPFTVITALFQLNFVSFLQNPISQRTQKRASLPIETVSSMLVAVSGTVTRTTAILSKAPVAHETSIAVGARHTWLAVAESRLGVASPAPAESCVGWTHWLAGASYGNMVRGDWDYVPRGHQVKWHFCKVDRPLPSSWCSAVLYRNNASNHCIVSLCL